MCLALLLLLSSGISLTRSEPFSFEFEEGWKIVGDSTLGNVVISRGNVVALESANFSLFEVNFGTLVGGRNVKGVTPIGFDVPLGSFDTKDMESANMNMFMGWTFVPLLSNRSSLTLKGQLSLPDTTRKPYACRREFFREKCPSWDYVSKLHNISSLDYAIRFNIDSETKHMRMDMEIFPAQGMYGKSDLEAPDGVHADLTIMLDSRSNERLVGFGSQPSFADMKNSTRFSVLSQENGIGRGDQPLSDSLSVAEKALDLKWGRRSTNMAGTPHTSYSAVPAWLSSACRVVMLEETNYVEVDPSQATQTSLHVFHRPFENTRGPSLLRSTLRFGVPDEASSTNCSWAQLTSTLTAYTGRQGRSPDWTLTDGMVVGMMGGSDIVRQRVRDLVDANVSVAAVWLQDWSGGTEMGRVVFDFQPCPCLYPDWYDLVEELWERFNVRVLSYANPFFTSEDVTKSCAAAENRTSMYSLLKKKDWLIRDESSLDGGPLLQSEQEKSYVGTIDLTNPDAYEWMKTVVLRCLVMGLREYCDDDALKLFPVPHANMSVPILGMMADFADHTPLQDVGVFSGESAISNHNRQPQLWSELTRDAVSGTPLEASGLVFHRSGNLKSPSSVQSFWMGDQEGTWGTADGIASLPRMYVTAGMSGWGHIHSDIGGMVYIKELSVRSDEILKRWLEIASFLDPVMRSHPSNGNLLVPQPWSANVVDHTRRFVSIHTMLASYKRSLLEKMRETGHPPVRHTLFCCDTSSSSSGTWERLAGSQLMLGEDLVFAPILQKGARHADLFVPPSDCRCDGGAPGARAESEGGGEKWMHVWSGRTFSAGESIRAMPAEVGRPLVLVRVGSEAASALSGLREV